MIFPVSASTIGDFPISRLPMSRYLLVLIPMLLLGFEAAAFKDPYGRSDEFHYDESKDKPWEEQGDNIPPIPPEKDFEEVPIDSIKEFKVFIDLKGLSIDKDQVVRYWISLRSGQGAINLMYEGMRCTGEQYKTYAFGNKREPSGYKLMPESKWMDAKGIRGKGYQPELLDYFCKFNMPKAKTDILRSIKDAKRGGGMGRPASFF